VTGIWSDATAARAAAAIAFLLFWLLVVVFVILAVTLAVPVTAVAAVATAVVSLWRLVHLIVHTLWSPNPDGPRVLGPEPEEGHAGQNLAYRSYYLAQVFVDVWHLAGAAAGVVRDLLASRFVHGVSRWLRTGEPGVLPVPALAPPVLPAGWVLSWAWVAGCGVGVSVAAVLMGVVQLVHLLLLVCVPVFFVLLVEVFAEFTGDLLRRPQATCPYPRCREFDVTPVYECVNGEKHYRLRPGLAGVLRRICACGRSLPTTRAGGRDKLLTRCPGCLSELPPGLGAARLWHIPVVGAAGAGKTALLTAILDMARRTGRGDVFPTPGGEHLHFEENLAVMRRSENVPRTTTDVWPLLLELPRGIRLRRRFVYFYDMMGEIYRSREAMAEHPHLAEARVMIFVADVLYAILPEGSWERGGHYEGTPVGDSMGLAYHELVEYLRGELGPIPHTIPLAVVVPKLDILLTLPVGAFFRYSTVRLQSEAVQGWLRRDVPHRDAPILVDRIEKEFTDSKFWAVSARDAVCIRSNMDAEVLTEVFDWVLGHRRRRRWTVRYR
jgi:hypothetical protein